jgi:hypothetical protein
MGEQILRLLYRDRRVVVVRLIVGHGIASLFETDGGLDRLPL